MSWPGSMKTVVPLVWVAFSLFEFVLNRKSVFFREVETVFLSVLWAVAVYVFVWCAGFVFLTFCATDLPLAGLLLVVISACFTNKMGYLTTDTLIFMFSVALGKAVALALKSERGWQKPAWPSAHHSSSFALLIGCVILLTFASWWHLDLSDNFYNGPRWMGLWDDPNTYGMLMGAGVVLAIGLLAQNLKSEKLKAEMGKRWEENQTVERRRQKFIEIFAEIKSAIRHRPFAILFIAAGMMGVGLVMSYSRGAWLATGVALLYLAWCYGKLKWRVVLPVTAVTAAVALFFWGSTPDSAPWYIKRADLGRPSAQNRATAWRAGMEIMRDHPFGVGWNNAAKIYQECYVPPEGGASAIGTNDYLILGTELGIAALVCFVAYVGLCYRGSPRLLIPAFSPGGGEGVRRTAEGEALRAACLAGALVFVVAFWFDGGLFKLPTAAMFWVLLELGAYRGGKKVDSGELMVDRPKVA